MQILLTHPVDLFFLAAFSIDVFFARSLGGPLDMLPHLSKFKVVDHDGVALDFSHTLKHQRLTQKLRRRESW